MEQQSKQRSTRDLVFTIVGLTLCALFAFILVCNVIIIIKGAVDDTKPPEIFGVTPLIVVSDSMHGTREGHIEKNDLIFIEYVPFNELQVGDVVTFKDRGSYTTHRLKEHRPDFEYVENNETLYGGWVTGGDYLGTDDPHILVESCYVGRLAGRIAGIGGLFLFLQTSYGMIICVAVPLGIIVAMDLINKKKAEKAAKEAKADKTSALEDKAAALEAELARLRALANEPSQAVETASQSEGAVVSAEPSVEPENSSEEK